MESGNSINSNLATARVNSILVVKLGGWADTIAANFMALALKDKFPGARITLVLGRSLGDWANALQFDDVILADDKALYSKNRFIQGAEFARLAMALRTKPYQLGFSLHSHWLFGALMKVGGVKQTVGFLYENGELNRRLARFDHVVTLRPQASQIDRYLELLKAVSVIPARLNFKLKVRQHVHDDVMKRLAYDSLRGQGYLAIGAGGGENTERRFFHKRWPYMAEFLRLVCEKTDLPVLLLGADSDRDLVPALTYVNPARVKSWVGLTTREEALAAVSESFAFVGTDSGLGHIAGSVGVPSVVIYGPTSSRTNHPPGFKKTVACIDAAVPCSPCFTPDGAFNWKCPDNVCMKSISPQDVWRELAKMAKMPVGSAD